MEVVSQLGGQGIYAFVLVLARVSGAFLTAPVFSSRLIPSRAKIILALAFTVASLPLAAQGTVPTDIVELGVLAVKEVLVGSAIAFAVAVVFAAVAFAGSLVDLTVGFSFANVMDPLSNTQISVMGQVYSLVASAVFVAIGGPELVLAALVRSFTVVPLTHVPDTGGIATMAIRSMSGLFSVGLQIAAPVIVALLATDAAVGLLARMAPQMNIFSVELPAKVAATFLLLALTAPLFVGSVGDHLQAGLDQMVRIVVGGGA
jgi:flagellar biosynthetic protein FliR